MLNIKRLLAPRSSNYNIYHLSLTSIDNRRRKYINILNSRQSHLNQVDSFLHPFRINKLLKLSLSANHLA